MSPTPRTARSMCSPARSPAAVAGIRGERDPDRRDATGHGRSARCARSPRVSSNTDQPSLDLTIPIAQLDHSVPCVTNAAQIGSGTSPVAVSATFVVSARDRSTISVSSRATQTARARARACSRPRRGFGIKSFEVAFLNRDGTPDTQAGSHPYEMVTNIACNTQIVQRTRLRRPALYSSPRGNVKDLTIHFPPGFVGDPNATTRKCTLSELELEPNGRLESSRMSGGVGGRRPGSAIPCWAGIVVPGIGRPTAGMAEHGAAAWCGVAARRALHSAQRVHRCWCACGWGFGSCGDGRGYSCDVAGVDTPG